MDIIYYWKDYADDLKHGRLGYFRSASPKLSELVMDAPDYIWVVKTPAGLKGELQLLARLRCVDSPTVPFTRQTGEHYAFYDPSHSASVRFIDSGTPQAIEAVSSWMRRAYPKAISGNFQGPLGQQPLRGDVLTELQRIAARFGIEPFLASNPL